MMTDMTRFESAEEAREYLRSEWTRTDGSVIERMDNIHEVLHSLQSQSSGINFEEVAAPFVEEWCSNNPEVARELGHMVTQVSAVVHEASRQLGFMFSQVTTALDQWVRNNPEAFRKLVAIFEILASDGTAAGWRKRYEEEAVAITFDQAARLAIGLIAFRLPYGGTRGSDEGNLNTIYDYEMKAILALRDNRLQELIEGAQSSPLDFRALEEALSYLLGTQEPIPNELIEWGLAVAARKTTSPSAGPGRSPYRNQVRDELIVQTVQALVYCGLTATRNEASAPESACDAVSEVLNARGVKLSYTGVAKIWQFDKRQNLHAIQSAPKN